MSPRTGRPIVGSRKDIDVKVRFDNPTHEKLLAYCEEEGITRTEAIRKAVELLVEERQGSCKCILKINRIYNTILKRENLSGEFENEKIRDIRKSAYGKCDISCQR